MLKTTVDTLFHKNVLSNKLYALYLSSAAHLKTEEKLVGFRTSENDPLKHTYEHVAQFYKLTQEDKNHLFLYGGLPKSFEIQTKTFNETCLMIRQPSVSIIDCLKRIDYSKPAVRFVLYGKKRKW
ncbi:hypothetical protein NQ314_020627 [Rhamnusium bicolor]|uniref:Small ribosomal subunit protein mS29 n=1 Tax=Rhamnusium bicolor TaxID=1586634 RepID=A0AAV8WL65_9CUCU|nr:hypothetical protein NQ314_020627 [Rhamnusium bicolor]